MYRNIRQEDVEICGSFFIYMSYSCALVMFQVEAQEKKKKKTGRARRRQQYNKRFVNVVATFGRKRGPNSNAQ